jgi:hypothetical protein
VAAVGIVSVQNRSLLLGLLSGLQGQYVGVLFDMASLLGASAHGQLA